MLKSSGEADLYHTLLTSLLLERRRRQEHDPVLCSPEVFEIISTALSCYSNLLVIHMLRNFARKNSIADNLIKYTKQFSLQKRFHTDLLHQALKSVITGEGMRVSCVFVLNLLV